jgi:hypothetical protein
MSSEVRILLEKYLTAYKQYGHLVEVFENPTASEFREVVRASEMSVGIILDTLNKKSYVFSRDYAIHSVVWKKFGDGRKLYSVPELISFEYEVRTKKWNAESNAVFMDTDVWVSARRQDVSFAKKLIPNVEALVRDL